MRLALIPLLLLPVLAPAAEPLKGKSLEETYIPASPGCRTPEKEDKAVDCPSDMITRAVKEAEDWSARHDAATQSIATPLPSARQLPPDELTPHQRQLMDQIKSLPGQIQR